MGRIIYKGKKSDLKYSYDFGTLGAQRLNIDEISEKYSNVTTIKRRMNAKINSLTQEQYDFLNDFLYGVQFLAMNDNLHPKTIKDVMAVTNGDDMSSELINLCSCLVWDVYEILVYLGYDIKSNEVIIEKYNRNLSY
jgi:hypothetical protein